MFRWPNNSEHTLLIGQNGSGKSVFAAHLLSNAPFDRQPYIVIDFKKEELFNSIERAEYIDFNDKPKAPGIYILQANPDVDDVKVNEFLYGVLKRGKTGLVYDEGYMIPNLGAMQAIYTQGRSKRVPVLTLTQRPVWLPRFAFSEAKYYGYFRLNDIRDQQTIKNFVPAGDPIWDLRKAVPKYSARWYDSGQDASYLLLPAPNPDDILQRFDERLRVKRKVF